MSAGIIMGDAAMDQEPPSRSFFTSLKGKSIVFVCALFAYALVLVFYVFDQKSDMVAQLAQLESFQQQGDALIEADLAAFSTISELFVLSGKPSRREVVGRVHVQFTVLQQKYARLLPLFPDRASSIRTLIQYLAAAVMNPSSANLTVLSEQLRKSKSQLEALLAQNRSTRKKLLSEYLRQSDRVALVSVLSGLFGLLVMGVVVALFFGRLTGDLLGLHRRVNQIVGGYRGASLASARSDELGELIEGVNQMAERLGEREQQLEIVRQKKFHQDKMGTIGHLAAGIVHEVGNPVAAILGLAEESSRGLEQGDADTEGVRTNLKYILTYADKLRVISEDLAAFNKPKVTEYEWINLNQLVNDVENITSYDERWYGIHVNTNLDPGLPAIQGVGEQLSQVLLNLLENSFESMIALDGRSPLVEVKTSALEGEQNGVRLEITDNGCGIEPDKMDRVFDAFYTTKEADRGSGLGLLLCHAIITTHGGSIDLSSESGKGTRVVIQLPLDGANKGC
ncbi:MAG: HAMP domain-containing sensor histidine kinase [Motiliproteus sp.]